MKTSALGLRWLVLGTALFSLPLGFLRAEENVPDTDSSPYHQALLNYKTGNYDQALAAINEAEQAQPGDPPTEILKARILTELHQFDEAARALKSLKDKTGMTPMEAQGLQLALGDLDLRQRRFDEAAKHYGSLLGAKPGDPDIILKIIYTRVGAGDFVAAGKYASQLKPLDPLNPAYYFAKAALAEATGRSSEAEEDIETVRTIYGITVANRYLKTYFEVLSGARSGPAGAMPPVTNPAPGHP